jgi:hypothetical protein
VFEHLELSGEFRLARQQDLHLRPGRVQQPGSHQPASAVAAGSGRHRDRDVPRVERSATVGPRARCRAPPARPAPTAPDRCARAAGRPRASDRPSRGAPPTGGPTAGRPPAVHGGRRREPPPTAGPRVRPRGRSGRHALRPVRHGHVEQQPDTIAVAPHSRSSSSCHAHDEPRSDSGTWRQRSRSSSCASGTWRISSTSHGFRSSVWVPPTGRHGHDPEPRRRDVEGRPDPDDLDRRRDRARPPPAASRSAASSKVSPGRAARPGTTPVRVAAQVTPAPGEHHPRPVGGVLEQHQHRADPGVGGGCLARRRHLAERLLEPRPERPGPGAGRSASSRSPRYANLHRVCGSP